MMNVVQRKINFTIFVSHSTPMLTPHITLTAEEKSHLESLLSKGTLSARTQKRANALKFLDSGKTIQEVSSLVGVSYSTTHGWVKRYKSNGLSFLKEAFRPGRPPVFDSMELATITALACSTPPEGRARWTLRLLSKQAATLELVPAISHTTVHNILKKTNYSLTAKDNGVSES
jgi:transposase